MIQSLTVFFHGGFYACNATPVQKGVLSHHGSNTLEQDTYYANGHVERMCNGALLPCINSIRLRYFDINNKLELQTDRNIVRYNTLHEYVLRINPIRYNT